MAIDLFEDMDKWEDEPEIQDSKKLKDMTEEERQAFESSAIYKKYKIDIIDQTMTEGNLRGRSVQEVLGLTDIKNKIGYTHNSIKCWTTDIEDYEDVLEQSPIMQKTLQEGESLLSTFKYLHQDLFLSLRKYKPEIVSESDLHRSVRMNRHLLKELINTPEFIKLRRVCRMDTLLSAWGAEILGKEAIKMLKDYINKIQDLQKKKQELDELVDKEQEMNRLAAENEAIQEEINDLLNEAKLGTPGLGAQIKALQEEMDNNEQNFEAAKQMANMIAKQCDDLIDAQEDDIQEMTRVMGKAMDMASTEVQEVSDYCNVWGIGGGDACQVAFQNKKEAIEHIRRSDKLKKMTDAIGRFKETAITEQKKKAKDGSVELSSVTVGDKIQDLLPSELMTLTHPSTKPDFYRKLSEKQTMVYAKEAHKQKNKGPIIVCIDTSGSMNHNQEIWSKAMAVGMLEIAEMQKRDFACIIYSSYADEPIIIKKDEVSPEKVIQVAEVFHGGGTDFQCALEKAIALINKATFANADIVFITDGDCAVNDTFLRKYHKTKEEKGFKTQGVLVNIGHGHSTDRTLKEFCDSVTLVSDIAELNNSNSEVNKSIFSSL